jgi:carbonic anhydrase
MSVIDELLAHNRDYVSSHGHRELATQPLLHLAVLTCMDSRLDLFGALGFDLGEAHLIRNAGGLASDDAIRSLLLSQRLLGTRSVMVIHHTRCGLETFDEEELANDVEVGARGAAAISTRRVQRRRRGRARDRRRAQVEPVRRRHRNPRVRLQRRRRRHP